MKLRHVLLLRETESSLSLRQWLVEFLLCLQAKFYISDACVNILFSFLHVFLFVVGKHSSFMALISQHFPKSLHSARKLLGVEVTFTNYVSCTRCHKLYLYKKAWTRTGSNNISKCCSFVEFPNHPQRKHCGASVIGSTDVSTMKELLSMQAKLL